VIRGLEQQRGLQQEVAFVAAWFLVALVLLAAVGVGETEQEEEEENGRVAAVVRRPTYLLFWSTVLSIVSVGGVGVASASSHRRWLRSAMIGFAVVSSGGGVGVSAAECTASTCCEVAIPKLPLTTTRIGSSVCNQGSIPLEIGTLVALTYLGLASTKVEGASGLSKSRDETIT
jgi:hypothetical protein